MAGKTKHHKRKFLPKTIGGWVGLAFKITGATVVASPLIGVIQNRMADGQWQNTPRDILYNYTGYSTVDGSLNTGQLGVGAASIVGGVVLIKIGQILSKVLR